MIHLLPKKKKIQYTRTIFAQSYCYLTERNCVYTYIDLQFFLNNSKAIKSSDQDQKYPIFIIIIVVVLRLFHSYIS